MEWNKDLYDENHNFGNRKFEPYAIFNNQIHANWFVLVQNYEVTELSVNDVELFPYELFE